MTSTTQFRTLPCLGPLARSPPLGRRLHRLGGLPRLGPPAPLGTATVATATGYRHPLGRETKAEYSGFGGQGGRKSIPHNHAGEEKNARPTNGGQK